MSRFSNFSCIVRCIRMSTSRSLSHHWLRWGGRGVCDISLDQQRTNTLPDKTVSRNGNRIGHCECQKAELKIAIGCFAFHSKLTLMTKIRGTRVCASRPLSSVFAGSSRQAFPGDVATWSWSKGQIFETPLTMTHLPVRKKRNGLMKSARQTPLLPFPANVNKGPQTAGGGNPTIAPPEIKKKHVSLLRTSYNYFTSTPRKYELVAALRENRR